MYADKQKKKKFKCSLNVEIKPSNERQKNEKPKKKTVDPFAANLNVEFTKF